MKRRAALLLVTTIAVAQAAAQPVVLTTEQDHRRSLDLLGIGQLREGANGSDASAPNAANYDEARANPYPTLPDVLLTGGRKRVTTADEWWQLRRPELVELFDREVYGRMPATLPALRWEVAEVTDVTIAGQAALRKVLLGRVDNSSYPDISVELRAILIVPATTRGPAPVITQLITGTFIPRYEERAQQPDSWQAQALRRGWAYAYLDTATIQADEGAGLTRGIIGLAHKGQARDADDWGVLRAWAWGASRLLDYYESDPALDATRNAIEGHSRWGKAALVAMAYDPRISVGYISSSGAGGAKLHRRNWGELVENVAAPSEYHWMSVNYMKYAGPLSWDDLPLDAHSLIALAAPRPVFISSGLGGDEWVDPRGMFQAAAAASAVYELLGAKGLGTTDFPAVESGVMDGALAFRQHSGGHSDQPNWPLFLDYAARYWQ
ncbi:MAG: hypothetical protein RLZZ227_1654 [Pseudomonadota bacterium]